MAAILLTAILAVAAALHSDGKVGKAPMGRPEAIPVTATPGTAAPTKPPVGRLGLTEGGQPVAPPMHLPVAPAR